MAIGSSLPRREDDRLLRGRGRYVADHDPPGTLYLRVIRSHSAHGTLVEVDASEAFEHPNVVAVATGADADVARLGITALSGLDTYVTTTQPVLARDKVRYSGEPVAGVVVDDPQALDDIDALVEVVVDDLPVHVGPEHAVATGAAPVHDGAPDNVLLRRTFDSGDVDAALASCDVVVERTYRTNRHAASPIEGRAALAEVDIGRDTLTVTCTTQIPWLHRTALAEVLGMPENRIRVIAPDVGGAFGVKGALYPEDVLVCVLARRLGRPVKWVEGRSEHGMATLHARDHHYTVRAGFQADGRLVAIDAVLHANVGAYSIHPWTAGIEPLMAGGLLSGPYKLDHYRCQVLGVTTNTVPCGPYRGVARPATTFVMERLLDEAARRLDVDPVDLRRCNLVGPDDLPYTAPTRLVHDSPTYIRCLDEAVRLVDLDTARAEQAAARRQGRHRIGVGVAAYNELTGLGQKASAGPRMTFRTGHECATVRLDPAGTVSVGAGVTSQGQGWETTLSQIVAEELGVDPAAIAVEIGDTEATLYGLGAFASRQGVIGGGAAATAARAVRAQVLCIAAHLLEAEPEWLDITDGFIHTADAPAVGVTLAEVAHVAFLEPQRLPPDTEPGLAATRFYDPITGTFAAGAQAAVVRVDTGTGAVEVLRFVCVEDAGNVINPMVVEGQIHGAVGQGIGGALYEHHVYDDNGQLLTATLGDYLVPSAAELPSFVIGHANEPADNLLGVRGVGEGGTLGPYAALANAVSDALSEWDVEITELPLSPERVWRALDAARRRSAQVRSL